MTVDMLSAETGRLDGAAPIDDWCNDMITPGRRHSSIHTTTLSLLAVVVFASLVSTASAQTLGVYSDRECNSSCFEVTSLDPILTLFIAFVPGGDVFEIIGADLKVIGLPNGWSTLSVVPHAEASTVLGDPTDRHNGSAIAFPHCIRDERVILYEATVLATSQVQDAELYLEASWWQCPLLGCCDPRVVMCDEPTYTAICVPSVNAVINPDAECTVTIEARSWARVKALYAGRSSERTPRP